MIRPSQLAIKKGKPCWPPGIVVYTCTCTHVSQIYYTVVACTCPGSNNLIMINFTCTCMWFEMCMNSLHIYVPVLLVEHSFLKKVLKTHAHILSSLGTILSQHDIFDINLVDVSTKCTFH